MKSGMHGKSAFSAAVIGAMLLLPGCEKRAEGPKPCCDQPTIPPGVAKFKIVAGYKGVGDYLIAMRFQLFLFDLYHFVFPVLVLVLVSL